MLWGRYGGDWFDGSYRTSCLWSPRLIAGSTVAVRATHPYGKWKWFPYKTNLPCYGAKSTMAYDAACDREGKVLGVGGEEMAKVG